MKKRRKQYHRQPEAEVPETFAQWVARAPNRFVTRQDIAVVLNMLFRVGALQAPASARRCAVCEVVEGADANGVNIVLTEVGEGDERALLCPSCEAEVRTLAEPSEEMDHPPGDPEE